MHTDGADIILTSQELFELTRSLGLQAGRLNLLPQGEAVGGAATGAEAALHELPAAEQATLQWALPVLHAPAKAVVLRTSLADEVVTQQALAWPAESGQDLAILNPGAADGGASTWRLGRRSLFAVHTRVRNALAAGPGLPVENLSVPLPTRGVVTLLAIVDHLRYARRYAELVYEPPVVSFTPREILARLGDAHIDDFRWPLLFFEKLTPPGALASYTADAVAIGLQALQEADIIEPLADEPVATPAPDQLYTLLPVGDAITDAFLHEVSKVGLTVTQCLPGTTAPDGRPGIGQDIGLFVRGATRLVLVLVSGSDAAVAFVDADGLTDLLDAWFEMPPAEAVAASQPSVSVAAAPTPPEIEPRETDRPSPAERRRPDGREAPAQRRRPDGREAPAQRFCTRCGAQLEPANRFCTRCGAPVSAAERSAGRK